MGQRSHRGTKQDENQERKQRVSPSVCLGWTVKKTTGTKLRMVSLHAWICSSGGSGTTSPPSIKMEFLHAAKSVASAEQICKKSSQTSSRSHKILFHVIVTEKKQLTSLDFTPRVYLKFACKLLLFYFSLMAGFRRPCLLKSFSKE